jgi:hypothetical protein
VVQFDHGARRDRDIRRPRDAERNARMM